MTIAAGWPCGSTVRRTRPDLFRAQEAIQLDQRPRRFHSSREENEIPANYGRGGVHRRVAPRAPGKSETHFAAGGIDINERVAREKIEARGARRQWLFFFFFFFFLWHGAE